MSRRISKKKTGIRIRSLLVENGLSVAEIQNKMELDSPQAVYKWLNGTNLPTVDNLHKLSHILGVPIEEILIAEDQENNRDGSKVERKKLK
ncbi:helix-turn-helix transcriptional regulator [Lacrimispora sp. 210928-DFI.3.58]|uniref:helix-turn-helix transcriptional regulator n=1 Tax=Lacrimispora sp. 210928-DFI.3.58 TaxID=2883214 RepID=UPI001D079B90|nr:helix-turn-helix transcriptional regulator [Lacrimispora sp. 210928-DFI.3.58]MCB7319907.1 helix-turn-helix domain-containing protein [Lacrimispora sp. 210928-DFI.3.58]